MSKFRPAMPSSFTPLQEEVYINLIYGIESLYEELDVKDLTNVSELEEAEKKLIDLKKYLSSVQSHLGNNFLPQSIFLSIRDLHIRLENAFVPVDRSEFKEESIVLAKDSINNLYDKIYNQDLSNSQILEELKDEFEHIKSYISDIESHIGINLTQEIHLAIGEINNILDPIPSTGRVFFQPNLNTNVAYIESTHDLVSHNYNASPSSIESASNDYLSASSPANAAFPYPVGAYLSQSISSPENEAFPHPVGAYLSQPTLTTDMPEAMPQFDQVYAYNQVSETEEQRERSTVAFSNSDEEQESAAIDHNFPSVVQHGQANSDNPFVAEHVNATNAADAPSAGNNENNIDWNDPRLYEFFFGDLKDCWDLTIE